MFFSLFLFYVLVLNFYSMEKPALWNKFKNFSARNHCKVPRITGSVLERIKGH